MAEARGLDPECHREPRCAADRRARLHLERVCITREVRSRTDGAWRKCGRRRAPRSFRVPDALSGLAMRRGNSTGVSVWRVCVPASARVLKYRVFILLTLHTKTRFLLAISHLKRAVGAHGTLHRGTCLLQRRRISDERSVAGRPDSS